MAKRIQRLGDDGEFIEEPIIEQVSTKKKKGKPVNWRYGLRKIALPTLIGAMLVFLATTIVLLRQAVFVATPLPQTITPTIKSPTTTPFPTLGDNYTYDSNNPDCFRKMTTSNTERFVVQLAILQPDGDVYSKIAITNMGGSIQCEYGSQIGGATSDATRDANPSVSPDGKHIAFGSTSRLSALK